MLLNNITITSKDIIEASKVLGMSEEFDEPRQEVIKCMQSRDVVACPGSGKTTALLGKLIAIARKMPFDNNKGICVLTHTNVAIDEIKEKLGDKATVLLTYPNFVGTIQSFVDRYLAIPASIKYYGRKPVIIDTNTFNMQFERTFNAIFTNWEKGFRAFCERNKLTISELRLSLEDGYIYKGNKIFIFKNDADKRYESKLKTVFNALIKRGLLRYEMAFELAYKYIKEYGNELNPVFTERFPFVFVDEMQDTNSIQLAVLNSVFNKDKIVFQCYGDPKQSIYDSFDLEGSWTPHNPHFIINSKRFNHNIARVADCIADKPYRMKGREDSDIPPIIITYLDNDMTKVLEIFAKIISMYKLDEEEKTVFKAVGMVKGKEKLGIKSYFPAFDKVNTNKNINNFFSLSMYLTKISRDIISKEGTKAYYNRFINAILKVLRQSDIRTNDGKYYSKISFLAFLKESDKRLYSGMHSFFSRCILFIEKERDVLKHFKGMLFILLNRLFNIGFNSDVLVFIEGTNQTELVPRSIQSDNNIFEYGDIKIEIDTVHGVKGQTHTATLYLETIYYEKTIENVIEYFVGGQKKNIGKRAEKHLKVAYVAMTRPKKLLCITMKEEVYQQNKEKLNTLGWVEHKDIFLNAPLIEYYSATEPLW